MLRVSPPVQYHGATQSLETNKWIGNKLLINIISQRKCVGIYPNIPCTKKYKYISLVILYIEAYIHELNYKVKRNDVQVIMHAYKMPFSAEKQPLGVCYSQETFMTFALNKSVWWAAEVKNKIHESAWICDYDTFLESFDIDTFSLEFDSRW